MMKHPADYIIFPLDLPSLREAREYITRLSGYVGIFKVGLELFIRSGHEVISLIQDSGETGIFLDLKLHDIPTTVFRAMKNIAELGITFATVHCGENPDMLAAATQGAGGKVGVLGVTVLTSVSAQHIRDAGFKEAFAADISELVIRRALMAKASGCAGVVCSGLEVQMIKAHTGASFIAVTPGIRPLWEAARKDDQQRVVTPSDAIRNGADYLVIGRPIRDANDPRDAACRIAEEIETSLQDK